MESAALVKAAATALSRLQEFIFFAERFLYGNTVDDFVDHFLRRGIDSQALFNKLASGKDHSFVLIEDTRTNSNQR